MHVKSTHPGVSLSQRTKGGVWNIRFFDTRSGERVQVLKSTLTDDHDIATKIANNVYAFINTPEAWDTPPEGYHPRAYELLGLTVGDGQNANALSRSLRILAAPARIAGIDPAPALKRAQQELEGLKSALKLAQQVANEWKRKAIAAEGQLAKMGRQANKARANIEGLTLEAALAAWSKTLAGDPDYVRNQKNDVGIFVKTFGESTKLTDMAGREEDLNKWLRGLKREGGTRDGLPISPRRHVELRRVVISFLKASGGDIEAKLVKRPGAVKVREARGNPKALTEAQARKVAENFADKYYEDCFRVQIALGLRPGELITLKKDDFTEVNGVMALTLSPLGTLTLKGGPRTIIVPKAIRKIINDRLEKCGIVFPLKSQKSKAAGLPWRKAANFDALYLKALRVAGEAAGVPFPLDCRVARRTCATSLLAAGVAPKIVADILGHNLQMLLEHYASVLPGQNDPSKAAI